MRKSCSCLSDGTPRSRTWGRAPCTCWPLPKCRIWCCASPTDNSLQFIELKQFPLNNELHRNTGQLPLNLESTTWNVKYLFEIWSPFGLAKKLIPFEFRHLNTFDKSFNLFRIRFKLLTYVVIYVESPSLTVIPSGSPLPRISAVGVVLLGVDGVVLVGHEVLICQEVSGIHTRQEAINRGDSAIPPRQKKGLMHV